MKALPLVALILVSLVALADEGPPELGDSDVQRLIEVEEFAFGGVGAAGTISSGESAFAAILKKKEAIRYLMAAFGAGSPEAQCYALVALRELSPELFVSSVAKFLTDSSTKITVTRGCDMTKEERAAVVSRIENGDYAKYAEAEAKG
jgi:hypothetical protein